MPLREFLTGGVLSHGFTRLRCTDGSGDAGCSRRTVPHPMKPRRRAVASIKAL
jgi:hypothetical protein